MRISTLRLAAVTLLYALSALVLPGLIGCGGGGGDTGGRIFYTVTWPTSRFVPVLTQSVTVTLKDGAGNTVKQNNPPVDSILIARPTNGEPTTRVVAYNVPAGTYSVVASAFPTADGTGVAMASGTVSLNIKDGDYNTVDLAMGSTISTFAFSPPAPTVPVGQTVNVGVAARDSAGRVVLTDPTKLQWSSTDGGALTINATGTSAVVRGNVIGPHNVVVTDTESGKSGSVAVQVTPGTGGGNLANILVADITAKRVVGLDAVPATTFTPYVGSPTALYGPVSVGFDPSGRIFISDYPKRILRVEDISGTNPVEFKPASPASAMFIDGSGRIYYRDDAGMVNRVNDTSGSGLVSFSTFALGIGGVNGIAVDSHGRIYVTDGVNDKVLRVDDMTGANPVFLGSHGTGTNQFDFEIVAGNFGDQSLSIDSSDRVYIADWGNGRIVRIDDIAGTNWTEFHIPLVGANQPKPFSVGVSKGATPKIYFSTTGCLVWSMDNMTGTNVTHYGSAGAGNGQFINPVAVAVHP